MKYRDHRSTLAESMKTVKNFTTIEEIKQHLNKIYTNWEVEEIKFEYVGLDKRIHWNTYYVLQRLKGDTKFTVAGMSDGSIE